MKIINILKKSIDRKKLVRKNFLINCVILTLLSILIALGSSRFLFKKNINTENFVTVEIRAFIDAPCNTDQNDTGHSFPCSEDDEIEIYLTRASATAFSSVDGLTYFLTAEHFCDTSSINNQVPVDIRDLISIEMVIYKDDKRYNFDIIKTNKQKDLCLITSSEYSISSTVDFASKMPDIGEQTTTISSPFGISEEGISLHFVGIFSGCNYSACFFTIPAISGSSGSLVLNYDNKIVGITQRSLVGFPEVTIGVGIYDIRDFIDEFEKESGLDITP